MFKLQGKIPRQVMVACSGGVDSMAVVDFLKRNHEVHLFYFNHGTRHGDEAEQFVRSYAEKNNLLYQIRGCDNPKKPKGKSQEEYWREMRYGWMNMLSAYMPVITCHHLDDCVETWVWSSMHGTGKIVPYSNGQGVIRPFRMNRKKQFKMWCQLNDVPYIKDESNNDIKYMRNYIRHNMMPNVLRVNPGIYKTISKKVKADDGAESSKI